MAGIGFVLRKLASRDDLLGILRAYFHSAVAAVGPWILLVVSLGCISFFTGQITGRTEVNEFFAVLIYNVLFSFVLSSPIYMTSARYVSDCLFGRDAAPIPGIFLTGLAYLVVPAVLIAIFFYVFYAELTPFATLLSIINFVLLTEIWFIALFLSCIRNFKAISLSWAIGMLLAALLGIYLGKLYGSTGMLFGVNCGLLYLLFSLKASILAEYPYRFQKPRNFGFYFTYYRGLFWSGLMLFGGMWVDKVIMWGAPEAVRHLNNLVTYPIYDGAMFFSYLSIIPVLALFIFSLETNFYESYIEYIRNIETNASLELIEQEKENIISKIKENGRALLVLQGCITLIVIVLAPTIFKWFGIDFLEMGIFRLGALGAFFAAINLCIFVLFSYFDSQENLLLLTGTMLFSNTVLTLIFRFLGFSYYGYGFCLSMILTFCFGMILFLHFLDNLTYNIFVTNVIKREKIIARQSERPIKEVLK